MKQKTKDTATSPASDFDYSALANSLKGKSTEEIQAIIHNLNKTLEEKKRENVQEIYEDLVDKITKLGYETIHDYLAAVEEYGLIKSNRTPRRPIPPRYRNSFNPSETWTGRGKQPKWLQALIAKGHKIEEFEIPVEEIENTETEDTEETVENDQ